MMRCVVRRMEHEIYFLRKTVNILKETVNRLKEQALRDYAFHWRDIEIMVLRLLVVLLAFIYLLRCQLVEKQMCVHRIVLVVKNVVSVIFFGKQRVGNCIVVVVCELHFVHVRKTFELWMYGRQTRS